MLRGTQQSRGGGTFLWLLVGLMIGGAVGAGAVFLLKKDKGIKGTPRLGEAEELALVPNDAIAFVHIRARDLWKSDFLTEFRNLVEKAGPEALAMLDDGFAPAPSTLDRITLVLLPPATPPTRPLDLKAPAKGGQPKGPPVPPGIPAKNPDLKNDSDSKPLIDFPTKIEPVGILAFTAPYDEAKVRGVLLPGSVVNEVGGKTFWEDKSNGLAAYFPSNTLLVIGTVPGVNQFVTRLAAKEKQSEGPLTGALELASKGGRQVVAAINARQFHLNLKKLKDEFRDMPMDGAELIQLTRDVEPLLHTEAYAIGLSLMGQDDSKIDLRAYFKDDKEAEEGEKAVLALAVFAHKKLAEPQKSLEKTLKGSAEKSKHRSIEELPQAILSLVGIGTIKKLDEYLANPPLKRNGKELIATFEMPSLAAAYMSATAAAIGFMVPAVSKVREAAVRLSSSNNLKEIGLGMMNYELAFGHFPQSSPHDKNDPNQLSWRVQLLPFVGEDKLYQEFKVNEPWDSPNNKKLIDRMPKIYKFPSAIAPPGETFYKVFTGNRAIFGPGKKTKLTDIIDGQSLTILAIEGGEPVIWTKPDDIPFNVNEPLPNLSLQGSHSINVLMADCSVRVVDLDKVSEKTLKAAITMNGGEVLGKDW